MITIDDMIDREVLLVQSMLIEELFKREIINFEDIENLYYSDKELLSFGYDSIEEARDNESGIKDIFEWWAVSEWLANKLKEKNEPILNNEFGTWWGRTCTGQAIKLDGVIKDIYEEMSE